MGTSDVLSDGADLREWEFIGSRDVLGELPEGLVPKDRWRVTPSRKRKLRSLTKMLI